MTEKVIKDGELFLRYPGSKRLYGATEIKCKCGTTKIVRNTRIPEIWECDSCKRKRVYVELTCDKCGKPFTRKKSSLTNSKSGLQFCSRECKDKAQSLQFGFEEIWPEHYGTGNPNNNYRERALKEYGAICKDCGLNFEPILEVHHIDGNRKSSDIKNLEVLCPTHHKLRHMNFVGDRWVYAMIYLTPREKLEDLKKELNL